VNVARRETPDAPTTCPVCASHEIRDVEALRLSRAIFARCRSCGLLFQIERTLPDDEASLYSAAYFELRANGSPPDVVHALRRRTFHAYLRKVERFVRKGTIVDVGCGEGYLLEAARDRGWPQRHGVDVSMAAIDRSAAFGTVHRGALSDAGIPAGSVDAVTCFDAFEHLWDPSAEAAAITRVLKPGGVACIVTPNAGGPLARLMGRSWFQLKPGEHVRLYSRAALARVLTDAGLSAPTFVRCGKFSTLAYATGILQTTNPGLAHVLRASLGWTPTWNRIWFMPSGDLCAIARRPVDR